MSSVSDQPKSILKKIREPITSPSTKIVPKSDAERQRLGVAVEHARLIQEQKAIMRANLDAVEELSLYPASSSPSEAETSTFLSRMLSFQPSDYDALIEERHVNGLCGYTLCANSPRKQTVVRPWLQTKGAENWCSDDCAKRALYVKAQLGETPAWERRAGATTPIVLYGAKSLPVRGKSQVKEEQTTADLRELESERVGGKVSEVKMDKVLKADILENKTASSAMPPAQVTFAGSDVHDLIEGYQPKGVQKGSQITFKNEDSDDGA